MSRQSPSPGKIELDRRKLWRLPAGLSLFALLVLPAAPWISGSQSESLIREGLAHLLAFGSCAAMLGLGLAVWIGVRVRSLPAVLTALGSIAVAVFWWLQVFWPLIGEANP